MTRSTNILEDFILAYAPNTTGQKVISFVSLRTSTKWEAGETKVVHTLTMRDDVHTNSIIDFQEECLMDTIFVFNEWLANKVEEKYGDNEQSAFDEANEQLERDFHNHS